MLTDSAGNAFSGFAAMAAFIALMIGYQDIKDGLVNLLPKVIAMPASSSTPGSTTRKQTRDNEGSDDESWPSVDSSSD